ncbi:DUF3375 family protein [Hymenobacter sp. M29]|uniref:DUF3375 family protein n=1 Tax=Hymenobacter mellowenesis TaxID=3063995 RepID=A0ABT9AC66_9BACT|nr:DUF3375 family protein [Hymenobacter sp. M29]MDO7846591.1 DUF3375 family protein [Hymenobacter sp. M29]
MEQVLDYATARYLLSEKPAPAIALLRGQKDNPAFTVSFLYEVFRQHHISRVPHERLLVRLEQHVETYEPDHEPNPRLRAQEWLRRWTDETMPLLARRQEGDGQVHYELTTHSEMVFRWLAMLETRTFVGTESRFRSLFAGLRELLERSHDDPQQRIRELEAQRQRLDEEIEHIRATNQVTPLSDTQVRERYTELGQTAELLLGDFKTVRQNFREMSFRLMQQQAATQHRGQLLGGALQEREHLEQSDQGQSFQAFWLFLHEDEARDEWSTLVQAAHEVLHTRQLGQPHPLLARLKEHLHTEADVVITAKQVLAEKLHRALAQEAVADRRLTATLLRDIRDLARRAAPQPPDVRHFITLETDEAAVYLPLARPPQFEPPQVVACARPQSATSASVADLLATLGEEAPPVDVRRLEQQLSDMLLLRPTVALADVVAQYGLPQGLPELVAYLAGETRQPAHFDPDAPTECLALPDARRVRLPKVYFTAS